ncbi:MAG: OmpH family outer membrane protein [Planctomycetota bacterium]
MKRNLFAAVLALVGCTSLWLWAPGVSQAQESRTPAAPSSASRAAACPIALVDMAMVFKNHAGFKGKLDVLRQDATALENQANQDRQSLMKEREKLASLAVGSAQYKAAEQEIAHRISELQVRDQLKKKEIMEREAKAYFETYNEVSAIVARVAEANGATLVMRYESEKMDANDRNSVLAGINRMVIYQRQIDLTQQVIAACGGPAAPSSGVTTKSGKSGVAPASGAYPSTNSAGPRASAAPPAPPAQGSFKSLR